MRLPRFLAAVFLLALALLAGPACRSGHPLKAEGTTSDLRPAATVVLPAGGRTVTFRVEVARTPDEHQRGLMYRQHLDADAGMLFLSRQDQVQVFWMKNTLIPLDMLFIDRERKIVGIVENAEPQTLTSRKVDQPSRYVLEIRGGLAAQLGIKPGGVVEFHDVGEL